MHTLYLAPPLAVYFMFFAQLKQEIVQTFIGFSITQFSAKTVSVFLKKLPKLQSVLTTIPSM